MRSITVGVTINLDHYENLRVEITDDDADRAIGILDSILARLGRDDPKTSAAIDSYRRRVFGCSPTAQSPIPKPTPPPEPPQIANRGESTTDAESLPKICDTCGAEVTQSQAVASAVHTRGIVRCSACRYPGLDTESMFQKPKSNSDPTPAPEAAVITEPEQEQPAKNPTPTNYTCEECQAEITKVQYDVSQMFMKRALCKTCMNATPKERTA